MRKVLLSLLLATTMATPALAQEQSREERAAAREARQADRAQARQDRSDARQERQQARPDRTDSPPPRVERAGRMQQVQSPARDFGVRERTTVQRPAFQQRQVQSNSVVRDQRREALRQQRADSRDRWVNSAEQARRRVSVPVDARPDRPAPPPVAVDSHRPAPTWRTDWRHDYRYDWRNYRHRHRSLFHLGFYFDPFGWGYQRWGIGWRLWPSYYSSNYWLDDPWMYRLPYAPWPYKWVRYYDDALLVNTYTGEVVDVIYDFFW